jgi:hypothetical protein
MGRADTFRQSRILEVEQSRMGRASLYEVAILIPCYNEAPTIAQVVASFHAAVPEAVVYVYDNNSTDETMARAAAAGAIVRRESRQGKGNVVRRMFADIDADFYILVDGDGTYEASCAPELVRRCLDEQLDMLNVARRPLDPQAYRPGHQWGNRLLNFVVRMLFARQFMDMLSGYRVFTRRFVKSFPVMAGGFEIETELTIHAIEMHMPVGEVVVPFRERPPGSTSKLHTLRDGFHILHLIFRLLREDRPVQFFGAVAVLLAGVGVILFVPVLREYAATGLVPRLPTFVLSTVCGMLACLSFSVGLLLGTMTRGRREAKRLYYLSVAAPWSKPRDGADALRRGEVSSRTPRGAVEEELPAGSMTDLSRSAGVPETV